ncbi:MAG: VWA domain-containing protein [Burkholderiaceae bacterium]
MKRWRALVPRGLTAGIAALGRRGNGERAALALAAVALAAGFFHPTLPRQRALVEHVVVLDVTQSMNVRDELLEGRPVSRLSFAKHALNGALQQMPCGSKLAWGLFTEARSYLLFTPIEVCANRAELRASLEGISGAMAWSGNSEVAKALHSGAGIVKALPGAPSLVFVTDGHEAPPLNPRHRPHYDDKAGAFTGLIVGVGQAKPSPIPKTDPGGRPLGYWGADDVQQADAYSMGRGASVSAEAMVEDEHDLAGTAPGSISSVGATPGSEHLSGLREAYLRLLAAENGLEFHRLRSVQGLADALRSDAFAHQVAVRGDARIPLYAFAFVLLLAPYVLALRPRRRA